MKRILFAAALLLLSFSASAKLSVKEPCSDGMVLQQKTEAVVWGHAAPSMVIRVTPSWDDKTYEATTDKKGVWKVKVLTPEASYTKHSITVKGDGGTLTINDVLVGEVWIASGQSNMEMPVRGYFNCPVEGSAEIIANAKLQDKVRMFSVAQDQSDEPLDDVRKHSGWQKADPRGILWMSATAFFFARQLNAVLDIPVGIVAFPYGGTRVESWLPKEILQEFGEPLERIENNHYHNPFRMYNSMQRPMQGYTAKGFIWYQGCSNVGHDDVLVERMTALVERWREDWGDKDAAMPFYQCEIAPWEGYGGSAPAFRYAQHEAAAAIPNGGIVVTNDLVYPYETKQIHPCQKRQVGERLAYLALNRDYGFETIACYSPEVLEVTADGGEVVIRFSNCSNGVDRERGIEGLEICGPDGVFYPVTELWCEWGGLLHISCPDVPEPREVRYGWGDFVPGNLHNTEGLPFSPFDVKL
ncbi:MAG: sialate O-acetylesterase [Bacteroidales bacterium]|nr:sialate O-acetylesterase [Bacteroidales bacterium]